MSHGRIHKSQRVLSNHGTSKDATNGALLALLLGTRTLLGAKGIITRSKDATSSSLKHDVLLSTAKKQFVAGSFGCKSIKLMGDVQKLSSCLAMSL